MNTLVPMWSGSSSTSHMEVVVSSGATSTMTTTRQRTSLAAPRLSVTASATAQTVTST